MTKKETPKKEKEKKLVWKLKDLPSTGDIVDLVASDVVTIEEARAILFKKEEEKSEEVEALKTMVKTLKEMVDDLLSNQQHTLVPYTKIVEVPRREAPYWNDYWLSTTTSGTLYTTATPDNGTVVYTTSINK